MNFRIFYFKLIFFISLVGLAVSCQQKSGKLIPVELTTEYVLNPEVVDVTKPRLAWVNTVNTGIRGQEQTAYQVRAASSVEKLDEPDLWDSEKVVSDQSTRVVYQGQPLGSRQEVWWQVRTWDRSGNPSEWSDPAFWRMGLLEQSDWKATWIGAPWQGEEALPKPSGPDGVPEEMPPPAPMMRKAFSISKPVAKAVAFVTGLGYFELYLNGEKVGNDVLVPNHTNYGKRPDLMQQNIPLPDDFKGYKVMYLAYDVTDQLKEGKNAMGAMLGNGFYNAAKYWAGSYGSPRFIGQLNITYTDGSEEVIVSDQSWKAAKSAIQMDMLYYGEHYDARLEQPGWNTADFDDSSWETVAIRKAPAADLVAHTPYPDKVMEKLQPVSIEKKANGNYVVDFGVEISGWLRLNNVTGPAGHKIDINYICENYSGENSYIFRGEGPENYAARFNWFVFSGVEIENWPGELKPEHLTAEAVNTYIEKTAEFETSNPLFNDINKIWQRSQLDNMHGGVASDCPHRERAPYTGDGQVACVTVMHNFDSRSFYDKWIQDIHDAQIKSTGYVPNGAPWEPGCGGGVAWGSAICIMPWEFYLHYGDLDMLEDNYQAMTAYVEYMKNWVNEDGIMHMQRTGRDGKVLKWFNLGEWALPKPDDSLPNEMIHTFYFWRCSDLTAQAAQALGNEEEAAKYQELAQQTADAFHERFYDQQAGSYGIHGANVFALKMGVPTERYQQVIAALKANIAANGGHLDTGIFGTQFFFEVLAEHGLNHLAFEAMNKRTEPSYGYWLEDGATTTREFWDNHGSHNHPMFGGGITWFYRNLAGMQADPDNPGYKHIIFKPQPISELDYVKYYNQTAFGRAGIHWANADEQFTMQVTVPVGSTATVFVPASAQEQVREGDGVPNPDQVKFLKIEDEYAVYEVGSGDYVFQADRI